MATQHDFTILQGETFRRVVRWESLPIVYRAITAITAAAPAVITAVGHGIPDGWRVAITAVRGMLDINSARTPPRDGDYHAATYISADQFSLNDVNAASFNAYTSGGYVQYNTPTSMSGYTARMQIRDSVSSSAALLSLTTTDGTITLDDTAKTISLLIDAEETEDITWESGVYDLEMVSGTGVVTRILSGNITVSDEVTR